MNETLFLLAVLAVYLIAAIPTGVALARVMGYEDVRDKGSGNIGATNVYRVAGKLPGILTLIGDILKGLVPILLFKQLLDPTSAQLGIAAAAAIVGHCYPVYLKFKGGKGVATAVGIYIILAPTCVAGATLVFITVVALTRYISLGSVLASISVPVFVLLFKLPQPAFFSTLFISLLVTWRHRDNIKRLLAGTESRFKA